MVARVGALLRAARERSGKTQEELAFELHTTQSTISKIETGRVIPDILTFTRWLDVTKAHEIAIAYLYGFDGFTILQHIQQILSGIGAG